MMCPARTPSWMTSLAKYDWQMSSLAVTDCVSWSPVQSESLIPVLFLNTESEFEAGQLASHVGAVEDDPTSLCTTGAPVKLASLATATSPAAAFDTQSVPDCTVVLESISNGVTPPSAACAGEPGDAASVIATGVAIAATSTRRRCLERDAYRSMCVLAPMSADPVPGSPGHR